MVSTQHFDDARDADRSVSVSAFLDKGSIMAALQAGMFVFSSSVQQHTFK